MVALLLFLLSLGAFREGREEVWVLGTWLLDHLIANSLEGILFGTLLRIWLGVPWRLYLDDADNLVVEDAAALVGV